MSRNGHRRNVLRAPDVEPFFLIIQSLLVVIVPSGFPHKEPGGGRVGNDLLAVRPQESGSSVVHEADPDTS